MGLFRNDTLFLRTLSWVKIPLLALCGPKVIERSLQRSVIKFKLSYWTQNHVGSMYFGALCIGAELSVASPLVFQIQYDKIPINFLFTDFEAKFVKKATGPVYFVFDEVEALQRLIEKCLSSGEKQEQKFSGRAVLSLEDQTPIMTYAVTLNLKNTKKRSTN